MIEQINNLSHIRVVIIIKISHDFYLDNFEYFSLNIESFCFLEPD